MNEQLFRQLLLESEGTSLDFKSRQYRFSRASDDDRSELLKDILAFANSFRRTDAYILIGVKEVSGQAAQVVGVDDHIDDAPLQQFVNSKTNSEVEFSYSTLQVEGQSVAIICIPRQERPVYLKQAFGRLKKGAVYYRLGSSTSEATPEVIARMGARDTFEEPPTPLLQLQLADLDQRQPLGTSVSRKAIVYEQHDPHSIPDHESRHHWSLGVEYANSEYWRELADFVRIRSSATPVGLVVENRSTVIALNVVVTIAGDSSLGVEVYDDLPPQPESKIAPFVNLRSIIGSAVNAPAVLVEHHANKWTMTFRIGDIQPNTTAWSEAAYLGPVSDEHVSLDASVSGDNIPVLQKQRLEFRFDIERLGALTIDQLREFHTEYVMEQHEADRDS